MSDLQYKTQSYNIKFNLLWKLYFNYIFYISVWVCDMWRWFWFVLYFICFFDVWERSIGWTKIETWFYWRKKKILYITQYSYFIFGTFTNKVKLLKCEIIDNLYSKIMILAMCMMMH